jgi:predicted alpha/beta superfamily hydrolase
MFMRSVRVIYPVKRGLIVLSVGRETEKHIEPESVSSDGQTFEFRLSAERPFIYCKPCLIDEEGRHPACGPDNLVLLTEPGSRDIYPHFRVGAVGIISPRLELESRILGRSHRLRIYLPPGYGENTLKRYPVIYMQDGKNLFFPDEAFQGTEWEVDETLDRLDSMNVIDKTIAVGIYAEKREEEYTKPGYELYGRSLVEEVKPLVDESFRTLIGPAETGVMGSSLGGVVSFYLAWQWPDVFGRAACLSSTFTWRDDLIDRVLTEPKRDIKIYLDSGWPADNYEVTLSMAMALLERGFTFGGDFLYFVFPRAPHGEASWAERFHLPLQLFSGKVAKAARRLKANEAAQGLTV